MGKLSTATQVVVVKIRFECRHNDTSGINSASNEKNSAQGSLGLSNHVGSVFELGQGHYEVV